MRHHTGTHLLNAALREILGPHVKQSGSLVAPDRLRFDFSHYAPVTPPELRNIENRVNGEILRDSGVRTLDMGREEALSYGALAFFGDKYGERVRVVEVPGFSKEFCGGTHVQRTGEIGLFLFSAEQGISAGTRRVEALTGEAAMARAQQDQGLLEELEQAAKVDRAGLVDEYARLREQLKAREREIQALKLKLATASGAGDEELAEWQGVQLWTPRFEGLDKKAHAAVVDDFRNRHRDQPFALLSSAIDGEGVHVITAVSASLQERLKAPEVMKRLGLRGGGRPDFAQGGGVAPGDVEGLRRKAGEVLRGMLGGGGAAWGGALALGGRGLRPAGRPGHGPGLHARQLQGRAGGHQRPRRDRLPADLPRQGDADSLARLPFRLPRRVRRAHRRRGPGLRRAARPGARHHPGRVRVRLPGRLVQGRPGAHAAHAGHGRALRRGRRLRPAPEHLRWRGVPGLPARPVRRRRGPGRGRLQRRRERGAAPQGRAALQGNPGLRAEGPGGARGACDADLLRPPPREQRAGLERAGGGLRPRAARSSGRWRRLSITPAARPAPIVPARPRTYYRWVDAAGRLHVASQPPEQEGQAYTAIRALD